jgi:hypothetical protein
MSIWNPVSEYQHSAEEIYHCTNKEESQKIGADFPLVLLTEKRKGRWVMCESRDS